MPWQPSTTLPVVTIWAALAAYAVAELGRAHVVPGLGHRSVRGIWSCACLLYLAHVASAFQFWHSWSHAAAYAHTATQVAAVVGLNWGGGIYANYAFTALWLVEVAWWWAAPVSYEMRPKGVVFTVRAIFLFMIVNGAVVFVAGPMRWVGAGLVAALLVAWLRAPRPQPAQR